MRARTQHTPWVTRLVVDGDGLLRDASSPAAGWIPATPTRWCDANLGLPWRLARSLTGACSVLIPRGDETLDAVLTRDGDGFALRPRDGGLDAASLELFARLHAVSRALLHDVRSCLSGASSSLEILLLDDGLTAGARALAAESVDEIVHGAERIRTRHARFPPVEATLAHVTLSELLSPALAALRWEAARRRVAFDVSLDPALGVVSVAPSAVLAAVVNLCHNAFDAAPDDTAVSLHMAHLADDDGSWLEVAVRDRGEAPDGAAIARAGDVGFSTRRDRQGLGLAATRIAAALQGGSVILQREGDETCARALFRDGVVAPLGTVTKAI